MKHRPEHDAWSRQILLGEASPAEIAARASELESCEICAESFASARRAAAALDRAGREMASASSPEGSAARGVSPDDAAELAEMTEAFERQALRTAMPAPRLQLVPRILTLAAALILGAVAIFFYTETGTVKVPDGGGVLGAEILVREESPGIFSWNAAGCDSFTVEILAADGARVFFEQERGSTRFSLDAIGAGKLATGSVYEIRVTGRNPRPGQQDPVSRPLRFSAP